MLMRKWEQHQTNISGFTLGGSEQQLLFGLVKNNDFPCKWEAYNILVSEQQWY